MKAQAQSSRWLFHPPFAIMTAGAYVVAICIARFDADTGPSISLGALYVLPVTVAAWCGGTAAGFWLALLCAVLPSLIEEPGTAWLSYFVRFASLAFLAWMTGWARQAAVHLQNELKRSAHTLARERVAGDRRACAFNAFLKNSPNLFCICDHEFRIQVIGASWLRQGAVADAAGRKLLEFLHPDDVGPAVLAFHESGETTRRFRARVHTPAGEMMALRFSIRHCGESRLYLVHASGRMKCEG